MANEISVRVAVTCANGNLKYSGEFGSVNLDQTNARRGGYAQIIGSTAVEKIDGLGDLTKYGWAVIRNLSTGVSIDLWANATTNKAAITLKGNDPPATFRLSTGSTWWAQAASTPHPTLDVTVLDA